MNTNIDPLAEILERHLIRISSTSQLSETVIQSVIDDYMNRLKAQGVHIPGPVRHHFMADLREEIRDMIARRQKASVFVSPGEDHFGKAANKKAV